MTQAAPAFLADMDRDVYFIKIHSEQFGEYWAELDEKSNTLKAITQDLIDEQHEGAVQVIVMRPDGTWGDVSRELANVWFGAMLADGSFDPDNVPTLIDEQIPDHAYQYAEAV